MLFSLLWFLIVFGVYNKISYLNDISQDNFLKYYIDSQSILIARKYVLTDEIESITLNGYKVYRKNGKLTIEEEK
ncbi:MAG: hypothetical protein PWP28_2472 [Oceanotoga sp.]|jgi:hypothetical protein|nr:hypothetical protein [Oceanotoga sp.]MDO7977128.1 hypothetical protein [Oceanotoga teriensis]